MELYHQVVFQMMDEPAYDFLRTKEQLGYLAYSSSFNFRGVLGGGFVIQSSKKTPEFMLQKVQEFLFLMKAQSDNLSDEDFKKGVTAVLATKRQVDMNLDSVRSRMYSDVVTHNYMFDRKEREIKILEDMISDQEHISESKEQMKQYFNDLFFNNVKLLTLQMLADKFKEQQEKESVHSQHSDASG
jgi:secreted Zn-dependent insulinase-like peptidase